jgi:hypothetical protein
MFAKNISLLHSHVESIVSVRTYSGNFIQSYTKHVDLDFSDVVCEQKVSRQRNLFRNLGNRKSSTFL